MGNNLTIDHGNSRVKVALWSPAPAEAGGRVCVFERCYRNFTAADLAEIFAGHAIDSAIWCSVANDEADLLTALHTFCPNVIVLGADTPTPLTVDYGSPQTLGVDRIAAAVGAWSLPANRGHNILVADIGTAITYDRVTADARYTGGNIAPGIYMRLCALNHYTARLPMVETDGQVPLWGDNTENALRAGAINGVVAELEYYHRSLGDTDTRAVLTGGAARLVQKRLSFAHTVVPDLVSRGLDTIAQFNNTATYSGTTAAVNP